MDAKVKIVNLLQGAAVAGGDKTDALGMASLTISRVDSNDIIEEDKMFFHALVFSVQNKVPLDSVVLENFLIQQQINDDARLLLLRRFSEATRKKVDRPKFMSMLARIDYDLRKQRLSLKIYAASLAIEKGYWDDKTKISYSGLEGAQELLSQAISESSVLSSERFPSGNVFNDEKVIFDEYNRIVAGGNEANVYAGYNSIDQVTGGFRNGELILIGAFTGEGKSMLIVNMAHNAAVVQGKNVVVVTAETLRPQYRRRLLGRHSCLHKFKTPLGVPTKGMRTGTLTDDELVKYQEVVKDFTNNPNYGYLNVMQITSGATMTQVKRELNAINTDIPLHAVYIDYLSLFAATRRRANRQEEVVEILREAKELAITFNAGSGIVVVSAHQMSSQAREKVQPTPGKFYTVRDFADTSEAGKSADVALALLRTEEMKPKKSVTCGFLKARDVECGGLFELVENYSASFLGDLLSGQDVII